MFQKTDPHMVYQITRYHAIDREKSLASYLNFLELA